MMRLLKRKAVLPPIFLLASLAFAAQTHDLPFGAWKRASNEPILSPQGTGWESAGTFNPAVTLVSFNDPGGPDVSLRKRKKIIMLYRAQDAVGTSRLGYAESTDGIRF